MVELSVEGEGGTPFLGVKIPLSRRRRTQTRGDTVSTSKIGGTVTSRINIRTTLSPVTLHSPPYDLSKTLSKELTIFIRMSFSGRRKW